MAEHENLSDLSAEVVEEYLTAAEICIAHKKNDGGCLGCPAVLLLLCVLNALGTYLRGEEVTLDGKKKQITKGQPFRVLNHPLLKQGLTAGEINQIESAFRNPLAHNALLTMGAVLTPESKSRVFEFRQNEIYISVPKLHEIVKKAWEKLDRAKIADAIQKYQLGIPRK